MWNEETNPLAAFASSGLTAPPQPEPEPVQEPEPEPVVELDARPVLPDGLATALGAAFAEVVRLRRAWWLNRDPQTGEAAQPAERRYLTCLVTGEKYKPHADEPLAMLVSDEGRRTALLAHEW